MLARCRLDSRNEARLTGGALPRPVHGRSPVRCPPARPARSLHDSPVLSTLMGMLLPAVPQGTPLPSPHTLSDPPPTGVTAHLQAAGCLTLFLMDRGSTRQHAQTAFGHPDRAAGQGQLLTWALDIPKPHQRREAHSWQCCWRPNPGENKHTNKPQCLFAPWGPKSRQAICTPGRSSENSITVML